VSVATDPVAAAGSLAERGYVVVPAFLSPPEVDAVSSVLELRDARGDFRPAATGAGSSRAVRPSIRGDRIHWIVEPEGWEGVLLERLEALRLTLNAVLGLNVFELECHYAVYPVGARYARHLDRSPAGAERVVSVVLYLNRTWSAADGGALRLYTVPPVDVAPVGGTLVLFFSERIEHEVLATRAQRRSLTGWYRRRHPGLVA
jgi:SM-20-related protein